MTRNTPFRHIRTRLLCAWNAAWVRATPSSYAKQSNIYFKNKMNFSLILYMNKFHFG